MCGPSGSEEKTAGQAAAFSSDVQNNYGTLFNEQQQAQSNLSSAFTPVAEGNAPGIGAQGLAAEQTQALNTTGANYAHAAQAVRSAGAGKGGDSGLESGVQKQLDASIASQGAGQTAGQELAITQSNEALKQQQIQQAQQGLLALSGQYNPNATASTGVDANTAAFKEEDTIQQEESHKQQAIAGAITGAA